MMKLYKKIYAAGILTSIVLQLMAGMAFCLKDNGDENCCGKASSCKAPVSGLALAPVSSCPCPDMQSAADTPADRTLPERAISSDKQFTPCIQSVSIEPIVHISFTRNINEYSPPSRSSRDRIYFLQTLLI